MSKVTPGPTATDLKERATAARLAAGNGAPRTVPPPAVVPPVAPQPRDAAMLTYDAVQARWPGRLCQEGCGVKASHALPDGHGGYDYWCITHSPAAV
jgi:hypothetical protein